MAQRKFSASTLVGTRLALGAPSRCSLAWGWLGAPPEMALKRLHSYAYEAKCVPRLSVGEKLCTIS